MNLFKILLTSFPGLIFIDIGANIGTYTILAAETNAQVIAIEAHPRTYLQLVRNITMNQKKNVIPINVAISDREGSVRFTDLKEIAINHIDEKGELVVPCSPLELMIAKYCTTSCIVKVDVEGNENAVIESIGKSIGQVSLLFVENGSVLEIKSNMMCLGYLGPFYFQWKLMKLTLIPQKREEDPIYISKDFCNRLPEVGILLDFCSG